MQPGAGLRLSAGAAAGARGPQLHVLGVAGGDGRPGAAARGVRRLRAGHRAPAGRGRVERRRAPQRPHHRRAGGRAGPVPVAGAGAHGQQLLLRRVHPQRAVDPERRPLRQRVLHVRRRTRLRLFGQQPGLQQAGHLVPQSHRARGLQQLPDLGRHLAHQPGHTHQRLELGHQPHPPALPVRRHQHVLRVAVDGERVRPLRRRPVRLARNQPPPPLRQRGRHRQRPVRPDLWRVGQVHQYLHFGRLEVRTRERMQRRLGRRVGRVPGRRTKQNSHPGGHRVLRLRQRLQPELPLRLHARHLLPQVDQQQVRTGHLRLNPYNVYICFIVIIKI
ncbi:hypothetical protein FOCC_FOCC017933, partial [Frankliniella occidentalis]